MISLLINTLAFVSILFISMSNVYAKDDYDAKFADDIKKLSELSELTIAARAVRGFGPHIKNGETGYLYALIKRGIIEPGSSDMELAMKGALQFNHPEMLEMLIHNGANLHGSIRLGENEVSHIVASGLLSESAGKDNFNLLLNNGVNLLGEAKVSGKVIPDILFILVLKNFGSDEKRNVLKSYLSQGADLNALLQSGDISNNEKSGKTLAHLVVEEPISDEATVGILELLEDLGANLNTRDSDGDFPVKSIKSAKKIKTFEFLLERQGLN